MSKSASAALRALQGHWVVLARPARGGIASLTTSMGAVRRFSADIGKPVTPQNHLDIEEGATPRAPWEGRMREPAHEHLTANDIELQQPPQ